VQQQHCCCSDEKVGGRTHGGERTETGSLSQSDGALSACTRTACVRGTATSCTLLLHPSLAVRTHVHCADLRGLAVCSVPRETEPNLSGLDTKRARSAPQQGALCNAYKDVRLTVSVSRKRSARSFGLQSRMNIRSEEIRAGTRRANGDTARSLSASMAQRTAPSKRGKRSTGFPLRQRDCGTTERSRE